jgi:hypothetical protein
MPNGDIETCHEDGQWHNRIEGEEGIVSCPDNKEGASPSPAAGRPKSAGSNTSSRTWTAPSSYAMPTATTSATFRSSGGLGRCPGPPGL